MNKKQLLVLLGAIATLATCANAQETFRTLATGTGIFQSQDAASKPVYGVREIFGHNLVAAALGVPLTNRMTNQVLAMQIDCASTTASLLVFDKASSNNIATIATSTRFDVVQQQDVDTNLFPNRERFLAQFAITPNNNLLGGFLTVAGRLQLNPTNGCPRAIRVEVDRLDRDFCDVDGRNLDDPRDKDILRAGIAHAAGEVDLIFEDGTTNKVLLPFEALSVRRQLD